MAARLPPQGITDATSVTRFMNRHQAPITQEFPAMQRSNQRFRIFAACSAAVVLLTLLGSVLVFDRARAQDDTPVGQWSVALARTDIPVDIASSFSYVGRWRLGIEADGTYEAERTDAGVVVSGAWTVDGNQITFTDKAGILSCGNDAAAPIINEDMDTGTYTWERSGKNLTLTRVDDACPGRVILLTTFSFSEYIACITAPMSQATLLGTPEADPPEVASPIAPATSLEMTGSPAPITIDFTAEIDNLLAQMTACWASREPERWLPLLSNDFRDALLQSDPNFLETLAISMSSPIVWERAGEITLVAPNQISATVRSTVGTEQDFQNFMFIFEDGQWKWNG
ncbi:MAG: hypothetical protein M9947_01425 [Thermomicrobiales bacterium]|nr:hypothetical protein [Thermomicrobiales bacterium]